MAWIHYDGISPVSLPSKLPGLGMVTFAVSWALPSSDPYAVCVLLRVSQGYSSSAYNQGIFSPKCSTHWSQSQTWAAGSYGELCQDPPSRLLAIAYIPTSNEWEFLLPAVDVGSVLSCRYSYRWEVVSCVTMQVSNNIWYASSSFRLICHLNIFFDDTSSVFDPFLNWIVHFVSGDF